VLSVRADESVVAVLGPPLLAAIRDQAPGLCVVFRSEGDEDVSALRDGTVDLDIGVQGPLGPEVRTRKLARDERVVLVRGSARSPSRRMSLRAYAGALHVDASRRGLRRGPIDAVLEQHGLTRRVQAVVPNQLAAAMLVARSDAISLVSRHFALSLRGVLDVRFVPAPVPLAQVQLALAWHPRHDGDAAHAWLRERLREIADSIRKQPARGG
jgi:DNA-binding transcriptional LysR family regulator